jgi:hypothetical protein
MPSMAVTPTTLHSRQSSLASPPGCGGAPLGCDMIVGCSIGPVVELCTGAAERPLWMCPRQHVQSTLQGAQIQPCPPPHELADAQQERVGVLSRRREQTPWADLRDRPEMLRVLSFVLSLENARVDPAREDSASKRDALSLHKPCTEATISTCACHKNAQS